MNVIAPILTSARLRLRPYNLSDFETYASAMMSMHTIYMGGPYTRDVAWRAFATGAGKWSLLGAGAWAIEFNGRFIGMISINLEEKHPEPELGWLAMPEEQGQGLITEAARTVIPWARDTLALPSLVSDIHKDNIRSQNLAARLGAWRDKAAPKSPFANHEVWRHWGRS